MVKASEKLNLNEITWIFLHVFQALQVDIQLWRLNTLSSVVVYHFYRKSKETINEAERKESSKSHGEFIRKAITFLFWLFIIMWCCFFFMSCDYFIMCCSYFIMSCEYFIVWGFFIASCKAVLTCWVFNVMRCKNLVNLCDLICFYRVMLRLFSYVYVLCFWCNVVTLLFCLVSLLCALLRGMT